MYSHVDELRTEQGYVKDFNLLPVQLVDALRRLSALEMGEHHISEDLAAALAAIEQLEAEINEVGRVARALERSG